MLELSPLTKLVGIATLCLPISLYGLYLSVNIPDRISEKDTLNNIDKGCIKICNIMYRFSICMSIYVSICISLPLIYSVLRLILIL